MSTLVLWEVKLKPELRAAAEQSVLELLPGTRSFPGCQRIEPHRSQANPSHLLLVEYWDSFEHYQKYVRWRRDTGVLPDFLKMCASDPIVQSFDLIESGDLR